ncbi:unnamed protein product [Arctogadus glacialis]
MEQRLSRGVLLEMEEEDGHGEDQASGGDPPEGSDLTAVRRLLEREASKQEQRWRSVQMQLNQLREDVEADRRPSPAPDPAPAPALAHAPAPARSAYVAMNMDHATDPLDTFKSSSHQSQLLRLRLSDSLANNGNDNPRCAIINNDPDCLTQTVKCWGMEGRFINLHKSSEITDALTFCEVKVYGEPAAPSMSIQEMGRNMTLVGTRLCWSDALLYCRDSHWDLLSLRGPEDQEMVDKLVARAPFPLTSHLWVGLRRSLSGSSWFWMSGDPMDFTQWDEGSNHSSPCGGVSSREPSTWRQRSCEEHLNFICFTGQTEGVKKLHFHTSTRENQIRCT